MNIAEFTMFNKFTEHLGGGVAEVGVNKGCSAEEMVLCFPGREIHLFDTFAGIPDTLTEHDHAYEVGAHNDTSYEDVAKKFKNHSNVHIWPGLFPDTTVGVLGEKFCFVNIDVDILQSTKDCWEFFYPMMCYNGVIYIQDDYNCDTTPGVRIATNEFLKDKPEKLRYWSEIGKAGCVYIIKE